MTEILDAVWSGFLIGFKYVGIAGGFLIGAYAAFMLVLMTMEVLNRLIWKGRHK